MHIEYVNFWPGFSNRALYERLLEGLDGGRGAVVVSVFPNRVPEEVRRRGDGRLRVSYSGEAYMTPDPAAFDVNIAMEAPDPARRIVWFPLFSAVAYERDCWAALARPRPGPAQGAPPKTAFCAVTVSNPDCASRNAFIAMLDAEKRVDSMGAALNNCGGYRLPRGEEGDRVLARYRFVVCFENTEVPHYLTEKLLNAWLAGAVPVYAGAVAAASRLLDPGAFLAAEPGGGEAALRDLVARVMALERDPAAYEAVRSRPLLRGAGPPREMSIEGAREAIAAALGLAPPA